MKRFHTAEQLRYRLNYSPETGELFWREKDVRSPHDISWNTRWAGKPAMNHMRPDGYLEGHIDRIKYQSHRVIFCIYHGRWPSGPIDHRNGDRSDNRILNIFDVSVEENNCNRRKLRNNNTGVTGVYWHSEKGMYAAQIERSGKRQHLGYFTAIELAKAAREAAEKQMNFGPNHGAE